MLSNESSGLKGYVNFVSYSDLLINWIARKLDIRFYKRFSISVVRGLWLWVYALTKEQVRKFFGD